MDRSGIHLWLILWKAHDALQACAVGSINSLEMCLSDFGVLEILLHKGPTPINEIGKKLMLTSGAITASIDRLEKRGLVERVFCTKDRRARIVHLTKAGEALISETFESHKSDMEKACRSLSEEERELLIALLKKLGKDAQSLLSD